ncbi:MAG: hypothetical protein HN736_14820 [Anaerolineae bacterium]|jgi:ABC-type phosphate transport system substrate-binding protein|nr:hypothetical protein [Anaerolineae bacterium]MBT3714181.1 hypothetical protein [Anaerolineae bacterium]MBT4310838.1 hypothetical protein [Anaerolineae bacterium]MBT4458473.1 hypothetical protein [Anaerolineae bacterium]MBT4843530.1 hypothetical protein [Anaerolineae bacterium]
MRRFLPVIFFFLTACTPTNSVDVDATSQLLTLYAAPATEEWIPFVYNCADRTQGGLVQRTPKIADADISLRLIVPQDAEMLAYQIGEIELVIVSNAVNPVSELTETQIAEIFEGKIRNWAEVGGEDAEIQIWVYGQENDLQVAFNETLLKGGISSSLARQAQSPREMREAIGDDSNAIGIISHVQVDENLHILHSLGDFPVLAISTKEPEGIIFSLLSCLQGE